MEQAPSMKQLYWFLSERKTTTFVARESLSVE
jgi:hypothetical protein